MKIVLTGTLPTLKRNDAKDIIENYYSEIGVKKSSNGDKMNEYKPHYKWAKKIMKLAYIYGVLNEGVDYNELIEV